MGYKRVTQPTAHCYVRVLDLMQGQCRTPPRRVGESGSGSWIQMWMTGVRNTPAVAAGPDALARRSIHQAPLGRRHSFQPHDTHQRRPSPPGSATSTALALELIHCYVGSNWFRNIVRLPQLAASSARRPSWHVTQGTARLGVYN